MRIPRAAALGLLLAASGAAAQPGVQYKRWNDVSGSTLSYLDTDPDYYTQLDNPDVEEVLLDLFEAPVNVCSNCVTELTGWFRAPVSGAYTFCIATDDEGKFYFGPSEAEAQVICRTPTWASSRQWTKYSEQTSAPQTLRGGQYYYMRTISNEAGGGDNNAIGVTLPDGTALKPLPVQDYVFLQPEQEQANVNVVELGAVPDGTTDSSAAFLNASTLTQWGGEILVPPGRYLTSAFNLSSHTRLAIYGEIHGLPPPRFEASLQGPLVTWDPGAENVSIVGNGTVANRGSSWTTNRVGFVCPYFAEHNRLPGDDSDTAEAAAGAGSSGSGDAVLGEQGAPGCSSERGEEPVSQEDCLAAAVSLLPPGTAMGRTTLQVGDSTVHTDAGSWGGVPHGCSVQNFGDWAAHYNVAGGSSVNNGGYTPVCAALSSHTDFAECEVSEKQRAALFAPLGTASPPVAERAWQRRRGLRASRAGATENSGVSSEPIELVAVLGGTSADYPGYGCLAGHNDQELSDVTLEQCQTACADWNECRSFDFYVAADGVSPRHSGHTCSLSQENFQSVGSTTSTANCRFYELNRGGDGGEGAQMPDDVDFCVDPGNAANNPDAALYQCRHPCETGEWEDQNAAGCHGDTSSGNRHEDELCVTEGVYAPGEMQPWGDTCCSFCEDNDGDGSPDYQGCCEGMRADGEMGCEDMRCEWMCNGMSCSEHGQDQTTCEAVDGVWEMAASCADAISQQAMMAMQYAGSGFPESFGSTMWLGEFGVDCCTGYEPPSAEGSCDNDLDVYDQITACSADPECDENPLIGQLSSECLSCLISNDAPGGSGVPPIGACLTPTTQMLKLAAPDANPDGWSYSDDPENAAACNAWGYGAESGWDRSERGDGWTTEEYIGLEIDGEVVLDWREAPGAQASQFYGTADLVMHFCDSVSLEQVVLVPWHGGHSFSSGTLEYKNDQGTWTDAGVQGAAFPGHGLWSGTLPTSAADDSYWVIGEAAGVTSRFWRVTGINSVDRFCGAQLLVTTYSYPPALGSADTGPAPAPVIAYQYIAEGSCRDDRGGHGFYGVFSGQTKEECEALCNADPTCHSISFGEPSGSCHPHCRESTEMCTSGANLQPVITPTTASPEGDLQCWLSPLGQLRTTQCTDTDNGMMGRFSYTCASIDDNLDKCTGYDANGFVAGGMCCQCGGGAIPDQGRRRQ